MVRSRCCHRLPDRGLRKMWKQKTLEEAVEAAEMVVGLDGLALKQTTAVKARSVLIAFDLDPQCSVLVVGHLLTSPLEKYLEA